jgi:predicted unusual protein kinase regulating ubiquinone biosynthesis (AarF/ABC1/UbiB family)
VSTRASVEEHRTTAAVLQPSPRRDRIAAARYESLPAPKQVTLTFTADFVRSLGRLLEWLVFAADVVGGNLLDRLSRRSTVERRAVRLRQAIERAGGTFIKFGQQIAMRIDLVPWEYCVELSKLLDRMQPFPLPHALAAIERSTGRPWHETFAVFDPEPVGSASIACVYQATLKDGTKVAVKIRRPEIGEVFMADFRVLDWVFGTIEFLALIRPGTTANVRRELKETLLSELDFTKEARYQHIFRINADSKASKRFLTAPYAYLDLSNDEVLVQEFVSGMWLWEIIAAVEQQDPEGLAMMERLNIDPSVVGRRILWASFWGGEENTFFHADPHPANIVVGRDSTLTFIDFGSCGSFDNDQRWAFEQVALSCEKGDAEGMARAGLKLFEPFPPVDLSQLMKDTEVEYLRAIFTFRAKAKHTQWWERTSATQWLASIKIARRYNLPLSLGTLRMIRATLLYDTLALRLDHTIDRFKEYGKFRKWRARFVRARWNRRVRRALSHPFSLVESIGQAGEDAMALAQHTTRSPALTFTATIGKWAFALTVISRLIATCLLVTAIPVAAMSLAGFLRGDADPLASILWNSLMRVVQHRVYQAVILAAIAVHVRQIVLRLIERDSARAEARRRAGEWAPFS